MTLTIASRRSGQRLPGSVSAGVRTLNDITFNGAGAAAGAGRRQGKRQQRRQYRATETRQHRGIPPFHENGFIEHRTDCLFMAVRALAVSAGRRGVFSRAFDSALTRPRGPAC